MPELINNRSGAKKMIDLAGTLCRLVNASAPAIRVTWPDSPALLALLTAAQAVCELVPAAQMEMTAFENDGFVFDPADDAIIPGAHS